MSAMVGSERGADRASNDADISSILPIISYGAFCLVRLEGWSSCEHYASCSGMPPKSPFIFVSERGGPFTTDSFNWTAKRAGRKAAFPFQVHAQMLRHAAGNKLAGNGHDTRSIQNYLGHKNIQHTVRYNELSLTRYEDFWRKTI